MTLLDRTVDHTTCYGLGPLSIAVGPVAPRPLTVSLRFPINISKGAESQSVIEAVIGASMRLKLRRLIFGINLAAGTRLEGWKARS